MRALPIVADTPIARGPGAASGAPERVEPPVRGERWLVAGHRVIARVEAAVSARVPEAYDPLAQTGAIANSSLVVAIVSGIVLLLWYSPSVHLAYGSVTAMSGSPLVAGLVRSIHRYSSDACMAFVLLHAAKLFFARRFGGARWLAWVTGMASLAMLWLVGWLGYWLVWDERAAEVARGTARVLDSLPIFADPLSRSFLADDAVSSLLFFVVFFLHMLLPLAMGIALWLHVTRLARPHVFTSKKVTAWLVGALVVLSLVFPADAASPARMGFAPGRMRIDAWYLLPVALTERLAAPGLWAILIVGGIVSFAIPWLLAPRRARTATVELSRCNGCTLCAVDCPYDAIRMVPRTDGREFRLEPRVDPDRCVGCGICVGACDGAGIDLPQLPMLDRRRALDAKLDALARSGSTPAVAFVCAESAAADLRVDPATSRSEGLPGYTVFDVPCAGWVEPRLVERAVRHGAERVLVVACGPGDCRFREGARWTKARVDGERLPALRSRLVPKERVRVVEARPGELRRVAAEAASLLAASGAAGPPARRRRPAFGVAVAAALTLLTAVASSVAYQPPAAGTPMLVVSFKHPGQVGEHCRQLSEEEKRKLPVHMRTDRTCERRRVPVRLQVLVDGERVVDRAYAPAGLWGDGNSLALERIPVAPGSHAVRVRLGDAPEPDAWGWDEERTIAFEAREAHAVVFDKLAGWRWH